jgi:hypothetical protein
MRVRALVVRVGLVAGMALLAAACGGSGGDDEPSQPAATTAATAAAAGSSQACADAGSLRTALDELDRIEPEDAGKSGIQAALDKVRTRLDALKASGGDRWGTQIGAFDTAVAGFQTVVAGVDDDDDVLRSVPGIVSSLEKVDSTWTALDGELKRACP